MIERTGEASTPAYLEATKSGERTTVFEHYSSLPLLSPYTNRRGAPTTGDAYIPTFVIWYFLLVDHHRIEHGIIWALACCGSCFADGSPTAVLGAKTFAHFDRDHVDVDEEHEHDDGPGYTSTTVRG
jgi:hypothetical protein